MRDLKAYLAAAGEAERRDAFRLMRELVEKIVVTPIGPRAPVGLEIHGQMAALLKIAERDNTPKLWGKWLRGQDLNL